eukprot:3985943-Prymnesium_polylepis.2
MSHRCIYWGGNEAPRSFSRPIEPPNRFPAPLSLPASWRFPPSLIASGHSHGHSHMHASLIASTASLHCQPTACRISATQAFAADMYSFVAGKKGIDVYLPLLRPLYTPRTHLFLYE